MDKLDLIYDLVQKIIRESEQTLEEYAEETDRDEVSFYDLSLDSEGMPYSFGNADDVYSDGFENGCTSGAYDLAIQINDILQGKLVK